MLSGQIIEARVNRFPLIRHFGVLLVEDGGQVKVLHNTPFKSAVIEPLDDWVKTRTVIRITNSPLMYVGNAAILDRFYSACKKPYWLTDYNCEHFIDCMIGEPEQSEQLWDFLVFVFLSFLTVWIICFFKFHIKRGGQ